jgi:hypothetical protein
MRPVIVKREPVRPLTERQKRLVDERYRRAWKNFAAAGQRLIAIGLAK